MFQDFRPISNNILIKKIEEEVKTAGGLYIPDSAKEETQTGLVIAAGPGARNGAGEFIPMQVKAGDTVFFGKFAGAKAGDKFLVLKEEEILGVIGK